MNIKYKINAIILASGQSNRMGENKLLLQYDGKSFIELILEKVKVFDFNEVLLVTNDAEVITLISKDEEKYKNVKVIRNYNSREGISRSIKLGVTNSKGCAGYMFFTVDQPCLSVSTIEKVLNSFENEKIVVPTYGDNRGMPTLFPKVFQKKLLALEDDVGGRDIIKKEKEDILFVEIHNIIEGKDVDTMDDYKEIQGVKR